MNKVILTGNLVADPDVKEIPIRGGSDSATVANFRIASSRRYKTNNGEQQEEVTFVDCEAWDTGAKIIEKIMKKGDPILVEGSLKQDSWEKDGQKFSRLRIRVSAFEKQARFAKKNTDDTGSEPEPEVVAADSDGEDIPF